MFVKVDGQSKVRIDGTEGTVMGCKLGGVVTTEDLKNEINPESRLEDENDHRNVPLQPEATC